MNPRELQRTLRLTLLLPIALLVLLAGFSLLQLERLSVAMRSIGNCDQISTRIIKLQELILDQETGLRGYQMSNDPVVLAPYTAGMAPIQKSFADLHRLLAENDAQAQRLEILSDRYKTWLERAERMIAKDPSLIRDPNLERQNETLIDSIRTVTNDLLVAEDAQRDGFSRRAPEIKKRQFIAIIVVSLLIGLIMAFFIWQELRMVSKSYDATAKELEQRSQEVHESRQWFQTTLESIGDAVITCDVEGRVQFMNAVATGLTGWTVQDAMGRPLMDVFNIIREETREPAENPLERVMREKKAISLPNHTALVSRQGREMVIDNSAAPITSKDGKMTGIVLVFHDVTEQRRAEAALIAGEKHAVAGRLAASIAHEIHNPLDAVANLLFLLRDEKNGARRMSYLRMAEQELGRTMQISRAMLSLYRESKAPIVIDLKELIEGVLLLLERRIAHEQIELKREFLVPCTVEGFPAELRQVVTNIVVNAIEAAGPKGRIRIRLEAAPAEEFRGAGALIEVSDSGGGIHEATAQRLFQPFFTTKGEQGTGLGLWVSMGIVQKHGGTMRLQNSTDAEYAGASASVYLPAKTLAGS